MNGTAPFGILFRYFGFRYLGWVFASIVGLTATVTLIQAIELARRASAKLQEGEAINVVTMSMLNLPSVIELTLPIALIAGSMLCFETMNRSKRIRRLPRIRALHLVDPEPDLSCRRSCRHGFCGACEPNRIIDLPRI